MQARGEEGGRVRLGSADRDLLVLNARRGARRVHGTTGLYHFAVLVPSRLELARALGRIAATGTPLQGTSDHGVSESLYIADPEDNGIEIYRDRPRDEWPRVNGALNMTVDPLDLADVMSELDRHGKSAAGEPERGLDARTVIGHVHLQVARLPDAEAFYGALLGFDVTQRYGHGALFMSAGGYHHHLGLNIWAAPGFRPRLPVRSASITSSSRCRAPRRATRSARAPDGGRGASVDRGRRRAGARSERQRRPSHGVTPVLEIDDATVMKGVVRALKGLSLTIHQGQHTAIVGPNGAGKSTLINLLTRDEHALPHADGRPPVRIFGEDRWDVFELRTRLGIVSADLQQRFVGGHSAGRVTGEDAVLSGFFATRGFLMYADVTPALRDRARAALARMARRISRRRW